MGSRAGAGALKGRREAELHWEWAKRVEHGGLEIRRGRYARVGVVTQVQAHRGYRARSFPSPGIQRNICIYSDGICICE